MGLEDRQIICHYSVLGGHAPQWNLSLWHPDFSVEPGALWYLHHNSGYIKSSLFTNHFSVPCNSTWCSSKRMTRSSYFLAILSLVLLAATSLDFTATFTIANTNISPDGYIRACGCISAYFMIVFIDSTSRVSLIINLHSGPMIMAKKVC